MVKKENRSFPLPNATHIKAEWVAWLTLANQFIKNLLGFPNKTRKKGPKWPSMAFTFLESNKQSGLFLYIWMSRFLLQRITIAFFLIRNPYSSDLYYYYFFYLNLIQFYCIVEIRSWILEVACCEFSSKFLYITVWNVCSQWFDTWNASWRSHEIMWCRNQYPGNLFSGLVHFSR